MEAVTLKLPETLKEDELLFVPATWEEYVALLDETPYTVQFLNGELFTGQASEMHETLVGVLIWLFNNVYIDSAVHRVLRSNIKIVIPNQIGDVNTDVSVVKIQLNTVQRPVVTYRRPVSKTRKSLSKYYRKVHACSTRLKSWGIIN